MKKKRQMPIKTYRKIVESEFKFWTEERKGTLSNLVAVSSEEEKKYMAQMEFLSIMNINLKRILDCIDAENEPS